jgi:hypothetical protein
MVSMSNQTRRVLSLLVFALLSGCKQKQGDDEAIRAAVRQHLVSLGTLNLQAMDTDFNRISVNNNQASADVSFRPKTGAPAGAAMQVTYQLEKQEGNWRVVKTSTPGGMIEHPNPSANPHGQAVQGEVHGKLPNFQEILGDQGSTGGSALPPGHPSVATQRQQPQPPAQQQAPKQRNP